MLWLLLGCASNCWLRFMFGVLQIYQPWLEQHISGIEMRFRHHAYCFTCGLCQLVLASFQFIWFRIKWLQLCSCILFCIPFYCFVFLFITFNLFIKTFSTKNDVTLSMQKISTAFKWESYKCFTLCDGIVLVIWQWYWSGWSNSFERATYLLLHQEIFGGSSFGIIFLIWFWTGRWLISDFVH